MADKHIIKGGSAVRIDYLRYLILVSETGSISQAAEKLYITQQGLSRIISNLEK